MMEILKWLNDQLLRMDWLSNLVRSGLELMSVDVAARFGVSLHFLFMTSLKFLSYWAYLFLVSHGYKVTSHPREHEKF